MVTARLDLRLDPLIKERAEKASALLGMDSLTEYVVKLMDTDASRVIAEHGKISVGDDIFTRFIQACDNVKQPNKALRDAVAFAQRQGFE